MFALHLPDIADAANFINSALDILLLLPLMSVTVRRLHDLGYSIFSHYKYIHEYACLYA
ncbi:Uncharacterised protein [Actinobacillus ureae]|nr:hypothetical protein [Actinobacillus ureae]SUT85743.1 Uncharacterised protein [Actinobacillus ureae]SUU43598.1 Uncharacterised protein [Actinobacillus ureae]